MHLSREYAEALGIDYDAGCLKADAPKVRPAPPAVESAPRNPIQALTIPGRMPPTLNQLMRGKIKVRIRLGREWREVVREHAVGMRPAVGKVRATIYVMLPKAVRAVDPDSLFKALGDSLVSARLLRGDSHLWVEWGKVQFLRCEHLCTVVVLEEV